MTTDPDAINKITLTGDLSMIGVTEQLPHLTQQLDKLAETTVGSENDPPPLYEVDLTGVQALDACGCQLLAAFLFHLRRRGAQIFSLKMSDDYRDKICSLGFTTEFFARESA